MVKKRGNTHKRHKKTKMSGEFVVIRADDRLFGHRKMTPVGSSHWLMTSDLGSKNRPDLQPHIVEDHLANTVETHCTKIQ